MIDLDRVDYAHEAIELLREIRDRAGDRPVVIIEGGKHTKVQVGGRQTTIPRHREINELTAKAILKQLFG